MNLVALRAGVGAGLNTAAPTAICRRVNSYIMRGMPKGKADFAVVREIGRSFPGVEESTYFGQPALKIGGRMFACMASHRSAEPGSLVVLVDFPRREELLAEAPDVYYVKDHYLGYPSVLARLSKIRPDVLRGLLAGAMQFAQTKTRKPAARNLSRRNGR